MEVCGGHYESQHLGGAGEAQPFRVLPVLSYLFSSSTKIIAHIRVSSGGITGLWPRDSRSGLDYPPLRSWRVGVVAPGINSTKGSQHSSKRFFSLNHINLTVEWQQCKKK